MPEAKLLLASAPVDVSGMVGGSMPAAESCESALFEQRHGHAGGAPPGAQTSPKILCPPDGHASGRWIHGECLDGECLLDLHPASSQSPSAALQLGACQDGLQLLPLQTLFVPGDDGWTGAVAMRDQQVVICRLAYQPACALGAGHAHVYLCGWKGRRRVYHGTMRHHTLAQTQQIE